MISPVVSRRFFFLAFLPFWWLPTTACGPAAAEETGVAPETENPSTAITAEFDLDLPQFTTLLNRCSETTREKALDQPVEFLRLTRGALAVPSDLLRLVDKTHALPADYVPPELVELDNLENLTLSRKGHRLDSRIIDDLTAMNAAANRDGVTLMISSSYRSYEYQASLFDSYVRRDGLEAADRYSARPGTSQHQLGTVVDFGSIDDSFAATDASRWLVENAGEYGFSLSYPDGAETVTGYLWESWHWRWIGADAVALQDRYFGGLQQRFLEFWDQNASTLRDALVD